MGSLAQNRIVAAITKAALDPGAWQGVTDTILEAFPGTKTGIIGYSATVARGIPAAYSGYDPSFRLSYEVHYSRIIPKLERRLTLPVGQVVHDREIVSEEELLRSEFFNDWLRPQGDPRHGAVVVLQRDIGHMVLFAARVEHRMTERLMEPVMQVMGSVYPLMQHALEVNRMTRGLRLDAAVLRYGIEPDGAAILLLGAHGSVLYANTRAEALLSESALIYHDPLGRIRFVDAQAMVRLASALDPRAASRGATFQLEGKGRLQDVRLMRLGPDALGHIDLSVPPSLPAPTHLLVLRPTSSADDEGKRIAKRLKLTRAEAEVALSLVRGATIAEVAASRGVSIHTVREQVKTALNKTGSRRQADLVRTIEAVRHLL